MSRFEMSGPNAYGDYHYGLFQIMKWTGGWVAMLDPDTFLTAGGRLRWDQADRFPTVDAVRAVIDIFWGNHRDEELDLKGA